MSTGKAKAKNEYVAISQTFHRSSNLLFPGCEVEIKRSPSPHSAMLCQTFSEPVQQYLAGVDR